MRSNLNGRVARLKREQGGQADSPLGLEDMVSALQEYKRGAETVRLGRDVLTREQFGAILSEGRRRADEHRRLAACRRGEGATMSLDSRLRRLELAEREAADRPLALEDMVGADRAYRDGADVIRFGADVFTREEWAAKDAAVRQELREGGRPCDSGLSPEG